MHITSLIGEKKSIAPFVLNYISDLLLQLSRAIINRSLEKGASYGTDQNRFSS